MNNGIEIEPCTYVMIDSLKRRPKTSSGQILKTIFYKEVTPYGFNLDEITQEKLQVVTGGFIEDQIEEAKKEPEEGF